MPSTFDTCATATILRPLVQQPLVLVEDRSSPASVTGTTRSVAPLLLAEDLPRDDVRVMLHLGDDDLVTGTDVRTAVSAELRG